jgi:hypothetical protein
MTQEWQQHSIRPGLIVARSLQSDRVMEPRDTQTRALLMLAAMLLIWFVAVRHAHAQTIATTQTPQSTTQTPQGPANQPQTQPAPQKPEPPPNIPLFPRYRRGLYKNGLGLWVIDGPPQSPPLFTDDPGVPDKGEWEINFTVRGDLAKSEKAVDFLHVDANYGVLPTLFGHEIPMQLKLEGPVSGFKEEGQGFSTGIGPVEAGVKLNFYGNDDQAIELAVYPQFEFSFGDTFVEKGLVDPGQTFILPVLVSKQFHFVTLVFNGGIEHPINDTERSTMGTAGAAFGFAVRRHFAVMGEFRYESPFTGDDDRIAIVNGGVMQSLGHYAVLYGNVGRSVWTADGEAHWFVGTGLKIVITPDKKKK